MKNNQSDSQPGQSQPGVNWGALTVQSLAITCEVFLHRDFGRRYMDIRGAFGLVLIFLFWLVWPVDDPRFVFGFMLIYLMACVWARIGTLRRGNRGDIHSRYSGWPRIMRLLPFLSEYTVKRYVEPLLVFFTGVLLLPLSRPLGAYLMFANCGLLVSVHAAETWSRTRVFDMNDALIEQKEIAERFRRLGGK